MTAENRDRKYFTGFVPHRLDLEERPELSDFPLNVLFANFFVKEGYVHSASALYEPDLESYREHGEGRSLNYKNPYREEDELKITRTEKGWSGEKVIHGETVLIANGVEWQGFFSHLTMNGLSKGEACKFERLFPADQG